MNTQTYANHRYRPLFWLIGALAASVALVLVLLSFLREPSLLNTALLLLAFSVVAASWNVRRFALRLQDRIIRLEMHTRLARLGRDADLARLSLSQIIALRFASDVELPALMARALAENLTADQIKQAVTTWQADHMRT